MPFESVKLNDGNEVSGLAEYQIFKFEETLTFLWLRSQLLLLGRALRTNARMLRSMLLKLWKLGSPILIPHRVSPAILFD